MHFTTHIKNTVCPWHMHFTWTQFEKCTETLDNIRLIFYGAGASLIHTLFIRGKTG